VCVSVGVGVALIRVRRKEGGVRVRGSESEVNRVKILESVKFYNLQFNFTGN
jgi:hypothetical protein